MDVFMQLWSEFGFPMTVTLYLLYRIEKKLDTVNSSIQRLNIPLQKRHVS
ncbi:YvrJ family protein [Paenalkalicoccus suaedae]|uniref:YvrJ family protein n=1 Tax=Paenalkalicoccus suaedae TaxID=2592382 RepID=A0A859FK95_9BACI|nr:YvrJ family protein [Paenalkalicoccus suaedae]QKS73280.1 YvrJ family protein [Paenalkalicoccus suaedae]